MPAGLGGLASPGAARRRAALASWAVVLRRTRDAGARAARITAKSTAAAAGWFDLALVVVFLYCRCCCLRLPDL